MTDWLMAQRAEAGRIKKKSQSLMEGRQRPSCHDWWKIKVFLLWIHINVEWILMSQSKIGMGMAQHMQIASWRWLLCAIMCISRYSSAGFSIDYGVFSTAIGLSLSHLQCHIGAAAPTKTWRPQPISSLWCEHVQSLPHGWVWEWGDWCFTMIKAQGTIFRHRPAW